MAANSKSDRIVRIVFGAVAALLVLLAAGLPVWQARLEVLQYPNRQLVLTAYGDRLAGDVDEIKILNHYVGLRMFDMSELAETALWIPVIVFAIACVVFVTFARPGWWRRLALIALWLIPVGILADVQFRLYQLGHSMDPSAPFTQEPFIPWAVGKVKVASNVTEIAWPGEALWCLFGAAALVTIGPMYAGFVKEFVTAGKEQPEGSEDLRTTPNPSDSRATVSG
jgi:hypothetical protein